MGATVSVAEPEDIPLEQRRACLPGDRPSLEGIVQLLKSGKATRVACLCGAGISVSAGIPDFRTPGTGLYSNLEKYEIEEAKILKSMRPDVRVGVLRNSEVATWFWNSAKEKMNDPATQDWWTQCPDKKHPGQMAPCVGSWGSPAGNTPKCERKAAVLPAFL